LRNQSRIRLRKAEEEKFGGEGSNPNVGPERNISGRVNPEEKGEKRGKGEKFKMMRNQAKVAKTG